MYRIRTHQWLPGLVLVVAGVAVGAGKELIYDWWAGKGTPSWADFGADCVGVGLAVACRFPF